MVKKATKAKTANKDEEVVVTYLVLGGQLVLIYKDIVLYLDQPQLEGLLKQVKNSKKNSTKLQKS